ncbi:MAG: PAS domain-containing protein, partial [Gammaproteobacteria bacterium]
MKVNMPVTNQEIHMRKGGLLISRTDLKGIITYVNDEFAALSGFSRDELIGAEHNIVRHPDMPAAAFEDMWLNLKAMRPWNGIVKNRTKSGDYYWVDANAMPIFKNGKVHEYLSVRRVPSREKIEQAEQLYQQLNAGKATIRPTGLSAIIKAVKEMNAWKKMAVALGILMIPLAYLMYRLFLMQDYPLLAGLA